MAGNDSSSRSARAKRQLRDSKGRFIEMGSKVRWFDSIDRQERAGVVTDLLDDGRAVIDRTDRPGGYVARVQAHLLEKIDEKATLGEPAPKAPEKPAIPTKTVKKSNSFRAGGLNVSVSEKNVTIEEPDGYGGGDAITLSKDKLNKIKEALVKGEKSVDLGGGTSADISNGGVKLSSRYINPNDGMPGPLKTVNVSNKALDQIFEGSDVELEDEEVPDYSKVPKSAPAPVKTPEPAPKFTPPKLAPRHKIATDSGNVEITDKEVKIFTEDGYGTGDSAYFSKDDFKKIIEEYKKKDKGGPSPTIGGQTITFRPDGSVNFYSRYINPNDGMPGKAKSVSISGKALQQIIDKIDVPLTASIWAEAGITAQELAVGTTLVSSNGINIQKISDETWEYKTASNKISYNNRSIDCFKSIDSITFTVESN